MIFSFKEDLILFWKADRIISGQSGLAKSGSQALLGLIFSQLVLLSQYSHPGGVSTVSGPFSHAGPPTSSSICSSSLETPNLNFFQSREIVPVPAVIFCSTFTPYTMVGYKQNVLMVEGRGRGGWNAGLLSPVSPEIWPLNSCLPSLFYGFQQLVEIFCSAVIRRGKGKSLSSMPSAEYLLGSPCHWNLSESVTRAERPPYTVRPTWAHGTSEPN